MKTERSGARTALSASCSARDWRCSNQALRAFYEPAAVPPGFGVRQSSGAFGSGPRAQKRLRTAAVQDASAPAAASSRFMVPMHAQKRMEAFHEPTHPQPLPGGEQAFVRGAKVPLLGGVRGGFMVPVP